MTRREVPESRKVGEVALSLYLKGRLPVKKVAEKLATYMEIEAARDVLDQLVRDGRITPQDVEPIISGFQSTRSAENHIAATTGVTACGGAVLAMVSGAGTVAGLRDSGITSGLAALGGLIGGGMAAGLVVTVAALLPLAPPRFGRPR